MIITRTNDKVKRSRQFSKSCPTDQPLTLVIQETDADKIIKTLKKDIYSKLEKMFPTCHYLIKHDRPVNYFLWLCEVDEMCID